jgi:hypothetical protein
MLRLGHSCIGNAYIVFESEFLGGGTASICVADIFLGCDDNEEADFFVALTFVSYNLHSSFESWTTVL